MSGDLLVDWLHFRRTFSELERTMLRRNNNIATWLFSDVMTKNPSGPKSKFLWSLSDRLDLYSQFECEDPRDKVYGLLGIVNRSSSVPEIDYNKSIQQVYFDTVRILLTEARCLVTFGGAWSATLRRLENPQSSTLLVSGRQEYGMNGGMNNLDKGCLFGDGLGED